MNETLLDWRPVRHEEAMCGKVDILVVEKDCQMFWHDGPQEKAPPIPEDGGEQC
jgi:hypothetical protein